MANVKNEDKRTSFFGFLSNIIAACFCGLLISICIEWLLMTFVRPELGSSASRAMALYELNYLNATTANYLFNGASPEQLSNWLLSFIYGDPFTTLKVDNWYWLQEYQGDSFIGSILKVVISVSIEYGLSAIYIITTVLTRITILVFSTPLFLMALGAGLCDGLVERELRRFGGGDESAYSFHYSKAWLFRSYYITWFIYLTFPYKANPIYFLVPSAFAIFILAFFTSWTFKKYF